MTALRPRGSVVDDLPADLDMLDATERQALWEWRQHWGEVSLTLENTKPKRYSDMGPIRVPMIELHGRRGYGLLRWFKEHREVKP